MYIEEEWLFLEDRIPTKLTKYEQRKRKNREKQRNRREKAKEKRKRNLEQIQAKAVENSCVFVIVIESSVDDANSWREQGASTIM